MQPAQFARVLVDIAHSDPIYDTPHAPTEVIYLLAWHIWRLVDEEAPEWTEALGRELDKLNVGITSHGSFERFRAYNDASGNDTGGGPLWHIMRVFQDYVGAAERDLVRSMEVSMRLTALMKASQEALTQQQ